MPSQKWTRYLQTYCEPFTNRTLALLAKRSPKHSLSLPNIIIIMLLKLREKQRQQASWWGFCFVTLGLIVHCWVCLMWNFLTLFLLYKRSGITGKTLLAFRKIFLSLLFTAGQYWWDSHTSTFYLAYSCARLLGSFGAQGRYFRLSYCLCPVLPDCKQWYKEVGSLGTAGSESWCPRVTPPWSWLWEQPERDCGKGCRREVTTDGKSHSLFPTGLLNVANWVWPWGLSTSGWAFLACYLLLLASTRAGSSEGVWWCLPTKNEHWWFWENVKWWGQTFQ